MATTGNASSVTKRTHRDCVDKRCFLYQDFFAQGQKTVVGDIPGVIPTMVHAERFISDKEADALVFAAQEDRTFQKTGLHVFRADSHPESTLLWAIRERVANLCDAEMGSVGDVQVRRLKEGRAFVSLGEEDDAESSVVVWLSTLPRANGGETCFMGPKIQFHPRKGNAVCWRANADQSLGYKEKPVLGEGAVKYWARINVRSTLPVGKTDPRQGTSRPPK